LIEDQQTSLIARHRWLSLHKGFHDEPFIRASDGVCIVPVNDAGEVLFISEPTIFNQQPVLFLPAGAVDTNEIPHEAANRELQEEIGFKSERLDFLHCFSPLSRHADWRAYTFLARDLIPSKLIGDKPYELPIIRIPLNGFEQLIRNGQLSDSTIIAALYMAQRFIANEQTITD
jgi:ADP-ribose diphosphatase